MNKNRKEIAREMLGKGYSYNEVVNIVEEKTGVALGGLTLDQSAEARLQADMMVTDMFDRNVEVNREAFAKELIFGPLSFDAIALMVRYKFQIQGGQ